MAQSNFFPSRPNLTPQIYAYSDPNYEGQLKVGYTAHDVRRKMRSTLCGAYSSLASLKKLLPLDNKNKKSCFFILQCSHLFVSLQLELKTIEL